MSEPKERPLNHRQQCFVNEYLKDLNGTQAAIRAGYGVEGARARATNFLKDPRIKRTVDAAKQERLEAIKMDANYVLQRLMEIDSLDVRDIVDDTGALLPIKQWPDAWCRSISGLDVQVIQGGGDVDALLKKIKWPDRIKGLELIGRHVDVQAFRDQIKTDHAVDSLSELMDGLAGNTPSTPAAGDTEGDA